MPDQLVRTGSTSWEAGLAYLAVIAVLIPPTNEFALLIALAITVAPLALLAAINAGRVAPFTAVVVVVGSSVTQPVRSIRLFIASLRSRSGA